MDGRVNAAATSAVCWGLLTLTTVLSHFPELEPEMKLLWSEYNLDLTEGQPEAFWTWMHQASESLSSWVSPSGTHSPPDGTCIE
jgi:hypothetical protein